METTRDIRFPNGGTRTRFADAKPGDLYWSMEDGDWHVIRTVQHRYDANLDLHTYRIECAGTINPVVSAGGPNATLEP